MWLFYLVYFTGYLSVNWENSLERMKDYTFKLKGRYLKYLYPYSYPYLSLHILNIYTLQTFSIFILSGPLNFGLIPKLILFFPPSLIADENLPTKNAFVTTRNFFNEFIDESSLQSHFT